MQEWLGVEEITNISCKILRSDYFDRVDLGECSKITRVFCFKSVLIQPRTGLRKGRKTHRMKRSQPWKRTALRSLQRARATSSCQYVVAFLSQPMMRKNRTVILLSNSDVLQIHDYDVGRTKNECMNARATEISENGSNFVTKKCSTN